MTNYTQIGAISYKNSEWKTPNDRTFRDAWKPTGADTGVIKIDMAIARELWKDKIRIAREPKLVELDAKFMKALETGTDTKYIIDTKNALRNATDDPAIQAAQTPEELMKVKPAGLEVV